MAFTVPASGNVKFGVFEADRSAVRLYKEGIPLKLRPQAFRVLMLLAERSGQVVTREEIQRHLWGDSTFVDFERGINFSINQIRAALSDTAEQPRYIETLPRIGYRFVAPVTYVAFDGTAFSAPGSLTTVQDQPRISNSRLEPACGSGKEALAQQYLAPSSWRRGAFPIIVACFAILIALGVAARRLHRPKEPRRDRSMQASWLTQGQLAVDVAIAPDGRYVAYARQEPKGQSLWLRQIATGSDVLILPAGTEFHGLNFSPDGNYIYFVRSDESDPFFKYLYSMPALGGAVRKLITDVDSPVSFSPNGDRFVYEHCGHFRDDIELKIANADGSNEHVLAVLHGGSSFLFQPGPSWSPDGGTIAVPMLLVGKERKWVLNLVSAVSGVVREVYSSPGEIGRAAWLPDGESLLVPLFDPSAQRVQIASISLNGGQALPITKDLWNYSPASDSTRDRRMVAAIATKTKSQIWVAPAENPSGARQVTSGDFPILNATEAFDGRVLAIGGDHELWIMNADGSQRSPFTDVRASGWLTSCGRFVVFTSTEPGTVTLMRVNRDGTDPFRLAAGNLWGATCSPGGDFVFYVSVDRPQKIWRVPVVGGSPKEIGDVRGDQVAGGLTISPDGKLLAYVFAQFGRVPAEGWNIAVSGIEGGPPRKILKAPEASNLAWSPDGSSLQYLLTKEGATNIWEQSLLGTPPKQLTKFTSGETFTFSWSLDRKSILMTRGSVSSDVVLLDFR